MKLNLKEEREKRGFSTADVASEIGVSVATVARCERENRWPENAASRRAWQKLYEEDTIEND